MLILGRYRTYWAVLRAQLMAASHFRANVLAWVLYSPLQLGIIFLLWSIVYQSTDSVGGFTFKGMMLYYLIVYFLRRIVQPVQTTNYDVWNEINTGRLDVYLARPLSFGVFFFFRSLGVPVIEMIIGVPFFVIFCFVFGLQIQGHPVVLVAFVASVLAGYLIMYLIQFLIGSMTFWIERIFGLRDMIFSVFMLFSGQLIPISALPAPIAKISAYLPFQGIYYIPAQILGQADGWAQAQSFMVQQLVWVVVLWVLAAAVWTRGVARYASQGG